MDVLLGGVGMGPGRRNPEVPAVGDELDCWRVEAYEAGRRLRLSAEMKLPGRAWLEFEVSPDEGGGAVIRQTAEFHASGLLGRLYWYLLVPFHELLFRGLLRELAQRARLYR